MIIHPPTPYYVAHIYFLPLQYAADLVRLANYSKEEASHLALERYTRYGKNNRKRLKEFDQNQFRKHLDKFLSIPNGYLVRKSPKHR